MFLLEKNGKWVTGLGGKGLFSREDEWFYNLINEGEGVALIIT